jgi:hypothetical protein
MTDTRTGELIEVRNHGSIVQLLLADEAGLFYVNFDHRCWRDFAEGVGPLVKGQRFTVEGEEFVDQVVYPAD